MNWKLLFRLSLLGLFMGISTIQWISSEIEPFFWLAIFIVSAYFIAKHAKQKLFLHAIFTGLLNCVWVTSFHIIFRETYMIHHVSEAAMMKDMPMPESPGLMMAMMGPIIGLASGIILGIFTLVAKNIVKSE